MATQQDTSRQLALPADQEATAGRAPERDFTVKRKSLSIIAAVGVTAVLALSGCARAGQGSSASGGPEEITMWTHSAGNPGERAPNPCEYGCAGDECVAEDGEAGTCDAEGTCVVEDGGGTEG